MKRAIFTTLLGVCAALPALSADLEISANGEVEYDDNVFRTDKHKDDDVLFRIFPGLRVYEDHGDDVNFSLGYTAPVEFSAEHSSDFTQVDHVGDGRLVYRINDRFDFFVNDRYSYIRSTLRTATSDTDAFAVVENFPQITDQRDRVKLNDGTLGGTYHFSPRTTASARATTGFFDSSRHDRARVWSAGATADLQHKLTLKHQIGAGAGYTFQDFGPRQDIEGSQTDTYRVFGTWRWTISPTLAFDLSAGPAYLETEQDDAANSRLAPSFPFAVLSEQGVGPGFIDQFGNSLAGTVIGNGSLLVANIANCGTVNGIQVAAGCGGNVILDSTPDGSGTPTADQNAISTVLGSTTNVVNVDPHGQRDRELTGFVDATLTQRWSPNLATALHYTREQGDGSGVGGTVIQDVVSVANNWQFAERWELYVRGDYVRRESAFDLSRTFDEVQGVPLGGTIPIASRTGTAFNTKENVEVDTQNWRIASRITHQLFKSTSIYVGVDYSQQYSKSNSLGSTSDFENFLATFGVRHVFEPIPLW
jgi:predicted porin